MPYNLFLYKQQSQLSGRNSMLVLFKISYHYVDAFGFREVPNFQQTGNYLKAAEMAVEDDYGMIDGIINNGKASPAHEEKRTSVVDKLKSQQTLSHKSLPKKSKEREI